MDGFISTGVTGAMITCNPSIGDGGSANACKQGKRLGNVGWGQPDYQQKRLYATSWWDQWSDFTPDKLYCLDVSNPAAPAFCGGMNPFYTVPGLDALGAGLLVSPEWHVLTGGG